MKALLGILASTLAATGVASAAQINGIMVLDTSMQGAISMSGSSRVEAPAVYVNSDSAKAVTGSGSACLAVTNMYMCGHCSFSGGAKCTGTMHTAVAPYVDPMSNVTIPTPGTATPLAAQQFSGGTRTIQPGYYAGGIKLNGGANVTLAPGVYFIGGTGLSISSSHISGAGVTLVMVGGSISMSGGATCNLSPTTTGGLAGVTIAQPSTNATAMSLSGGSGVTITGAIYVPGALVTLSGSSSVAGQGPMLGDAVVAKCVALSGSGTIKVGTAQTGSTWTAPLPSMPLFD
jgi:hypothetical protein